MKIYYNLKKNFARYTWMQNFDSKLWLTNNKNVL